MSVEELILLMEVEDERLQSNPLDGSANARYKEYYNLMLKKQNEKDNLSS